MTIDYRYVGAERKTLVTALGQILKEKVQYLGAPSFAYQVGEYHIDKHGTLTGPDSVDLSDILLQNGFTAAYESSDEEEYDDEYPPAQLTIEMPLAGFTPETLDNLCKMVIAKAPLIKAALDADDLPIQTTEETVRFPWFKEEELMPCDTVNAYSAFVSCLCETAKAKKRVTAKEKPLEGSPKYAMRCFLLSLGMIGEKYKNARKILLSKLEGNGAWKNGAPKKEEPTVSETA